MNPRNHATARVDLYECRPFSEDVERAIATVRAKDGVEVQLSVPFTKTPIGQTAPGKYAARWNEVIAALSQRRAWPYGERGWEVPILCGDALIGNETGAAYSGIAEDERIDLGAFREALEEVCSDPSRIWVSGLYRAEMPRGE